MKLGQYSDDEEEALCEANPTVDAVEKEIASYQLEENEGRLDVIDWWKIN